MGSLSLREYRRFPRETLMIHEKDHLTRNDFENFSKKFSTLTSSVPSIWYPIYRELDRPNSFSKLSTLNSF